MENIDRFIIICLFKAVVAAAQRLGCCDKPRQVPWRAAKRCREAIITSNISNY